MSTKNQRSIKRYDTTYGIGEIELTVEVDYSKTTVEEINCFAKGHHDYERLLKESKYDPVGCFLKLLTKQCFKLCLLKDLNYQRLVEEFDDKRGRGVDLFPPMCGEKGVAIVGFNYVEFDPVLFDASICQKQD